MHRLMKSFQSSNTEGYIYFKEGSVDRLSVVCQSTTLVQPEM